MKCLSVVLIGLSMLCCLVINPVHAYSENFIVEAGESVKRTLNLNEGDRVSGRIVVVDSENSLNFSIIDSDQNPIQSYQDVGSRNFQFTALKSGVYVLQFVAAEAKQVTLNYAVQHYIFGFPQEYVLVSIVVGLAICAVAVFTVLSPKP